jgi:thiamine transporter ThiT
MQGCIPGSLVEAKMGFLIGIAGLVTGFVGFWLDFSADPFGARPSQSFFDLGIAGIALAIAGFIVQMWPRRRIVPKGGQAA